MQQQACHLQNWWCHGDFDQLLTCSCLMWKQECSKNNSNRKRIMTQRKDWEDLHQRTMCSSETTPTALNGFQLLLQAHQVQCRTPSPSEVVIPWSVMWIRLEPDWQTLFTDSEPDTEQELLPDTEAGSKGCLPSMMDTTPQPMSCEPQEPQHAPCTQTQPDSLVAPVVRRSQRERCAPVCFQDFVR